jgi:hydroxypyruvate isomerase
MPRFSANLSLLFTELPLLERFRAARECGFQGVEIQFPYDTPAANIKAQIDLTGLELVLFNVPAGDLMNGGEGLAAVSSKHHDFIDAVNKSVEYADILRPKLINILPGCCYKTNRLDQYMETFKSNLDHAADVFFENGIKTVFEAVNTKDMPGFLIHNSEQMIQVLEDLNHSNIYLQYDIYHMQTMGENHLAFFQRYAEKVGHIQFADAPGRHQPGTGKIDFVSLFNAIDASGYQGWLGAEYRPSVPTRDSLDWFGRNYRSLARKI